MNMSDNVRQKIKALHYNGSDESQYEALHSVLTKGIVTPALREMILERLTTQDFEELIQIEHC